MNRKTFDTISQYKKETLTGVGTLCWNNPAGGELKDLLIYGNSVVHGTPSNSSPVEITSNECKYRCCGKNMWGGNAMKSDLLDNGATDNNDGSVSITAQMTETSKTLLKTNFDKNTPYTIILYGRNYNMDSRDPCIKIEYTDNSTDWLQFESSDENCYCVFTTPQNKQIKRLVTRENGESSVLYYDKCGLFKGILTRDDFEAYFDGGTIIAPEPLLSAKNKSDVWHVSKGGIIHNVEEIIIDGVNYYANALLEKDNCLYAYIKDGLKSGGSTADIISTHFIGGAFYKPNYIYHLGAPKYLYMFLENQNFKTKEEVNAWFQSEFAAGTPIRVIRSIELIYAGFTEPQKLISPRGFGQIIEIGDTLGAKIEASYITHT